MKYLKKFSNHSDYNTFTGSTEFIKPNVSHCIQENDVHYNPKEDGVTYSVTVLGEAPHGDFTIIWGDEKEEHIGNRTGTYTYKTQNEALGNVVVRFNNTFVTWVEYTARPYGDFLDKNNPSVTVTLLEWTYKLRGLDEYDSYDSRDLFCENGENVITREDVESIASTMDPNRYLIGECIDRIDDEAFSSVLSASKTLIFYATTPPTLGYNVFGDEWFTINILVPAESLNAYKTAEGWSEYANIIFPIE